MESPGVPIDHQSEQFSRLPSEIERCASSPPKERGQHGEDMRFRPSPEAMVESTPLLSPSPRREDRRRVEVDLSKTEAILPAAKGSVV